MDEEWRSILGYDYEVSNLGNVRNVKTRRILKFATDNGYSQVDLCNNGKRKNCKVHRLVLQTFNPTEEELDCDHINHIKNDNRLCNLRWATKSENTRYKKKRECCSSQYLGVSWSNRDKKWKTSSTLNGKKIYLGCFDDEKDAGKAYNDFIIKHELQAFSILNDI